MDTLGTLGPTTAPTLGSGESAHVPVGSLVTVTIGRNVSTGRPDPGGEGKPAVAPMPDQRWADFVSLTVGALQLNFRATTFGPFYGIGVWDGVVEDSATVTIVTEHPVDVERFDRALSELARVFGQDAIAWSFGPARLARS